MGSHTAQTPRTRRLPGRCTLCGTRTADDYCYAHTWADSELERARIYRDGFRAGRRSVTLPSRPAGSSEPVGNRSKSRRPSSSSTQMHVGYQPTTEEEYRAVD